MLKLDDNALNVFIPDKLNITGRSELSEFPKHIFMARNMPIHGYVNIAYVVYEPELHTFTQKDELREMNYLNKFDPEFRIKISFNNKYYIGVKYRGDQEISQATAPNWGSFFAHLDAIGITNGEGCKFRKTDKKATPRPPRIIESTEEDIKRERGLTSDVPLELAGMGRYYPIKGSVYTYNDSKKYSVQDRNKHYTRGQFNQLIPIGSEEEAKKRGLEYTEHLFPLEH